MQMSAFKHYQTALEAGTRLLVMSGDADTVCPWRGSHSWVSSLYCLEISDSNTEDVPTVQSKLEELPCSELDIIRGGSPC